MKQLLPGIYVTSSHVQKLQSVVVVTNDALLVVDPGYFTDEVSHIRQFAQPFENSSRNRYVILTHSDFDHILGVPSFPGYRVLTANTWDEANEIRAIERAWRFDSEFYVDRDWEGPMPRISIDQRLADSESLDGVTFYHASGHTADGLVAVSGQVAIVGDYLSAVEFPFVYTSYRMYLNTLEHFRSIFERHAVQCVISQHGPAATDVTEIKRRIDLSEDYILRVERLVIEGIRNHLSEDAILSEGRVFQYDGASIPVGIQRFHENNIRLVWQELTA